MKQIALQMSIDELNLILEGLGYLPFAKVYTLVGEIHEQAGPQLAGGAPAGQPAGGPTQAGSQLAGRAPAGQQIGGVQESSVQASSVQASSVQEGGAQAEGEGAASRLQVSSRAQTVNLEEGVEEEDITVNMREVGHE